MLQPAGPEHVPAPPLIHRSLPEGALLRGDEEEPLDALLDALVAALGASFVLCTEGPPGGHTIGRAPPANALAAPEELVPDGLVEEALRIRRPFLREIESPDGPAWIAGCPIPHPRGPWAVVLAEGPGRLPAGDGSRVFACLERLAPWLALAHEVATLRRENRRLAEPPPAETWPAAALYLPEEGASSEARSEDFPGIIACSAAMREVLRTVALVAPSDAAVLLEGESGTGKELIARAIHQNSRRAGGPFISENCAACPEGLMESEFFGVERGAFTGAQRSKPGLFERSHGGTLFLDEIGEMDPVLQRKLLRALQEREVRRVGGAEPIAVDFRLVSATNRTLSEEVGGGRFRADLLYRIDVVTIRLPPLRERPEDVPRLLEHFLAVHARSAGIEPPAIDPAALRLLAEYSWPGNVRELANEVSRAVALRITTLTPASLSARIRREACAAWEVDRRLMQPGRSLDELERDLLGGFIREALRRTGGNKKRAAQILGIPKTNLYRRLRRYAIQEHSLSSTRTAPRAPA